MKLSNLPNCDLTYCTNIHAASGWRNVMATLEQYAPALKARLAPEERFGIGLRLSAEESRELLQGGHLQEFREFLEERGCYVAVINGFPYGSFPQPGDQAGRVRARLADGGPAELYAAAGGNFVGAAAGRNGRWNFYVAAVVQRLVRRRSGRVAVAGDD